jgi:hypothetical protein
VRGRPTRHMSAMIAKTAVRRSEPCVDAGHVRAASPKRHDRATVTSRPNGVRLVGSSKNQHVMVNRVARAASRAPVTTVVARSTTAVPTRVCAPSASHATEGERKVVARKSPPAHAKSVAVPKGVCAKRPPPPSSVERRVVARKSPPAHAKSVVVLKGVSAKRPPPPTSVERRVVARKSPPVLAKSAAVQKGTLALGTGGAVGPKTPGKGTTRRRKRSSIGSDFGSQAELGRRGNARWRRSRPVGLRPSPLDGRSSTLAIPKGSG